ncbi:protein MTSS 2 isoform X2 [Belonocnema kinseyi]|uniref:protein MTSS 2 isoform X2 n=1 Tax=Belonocnema kinseyi TaxID=2817044 RepID=UPI00143CCA62|nr:protein MTSS 2 isoform X2 [Belonocnema kinseyi]
MDVNIERECSALGRLFQQIITDMKNGAPLWEDLILKATKLHSCLRSAILAISAYLEAFQKIADSATNAKGATKEIGTALTRICLRHKAVETRMKSFTSAIMDCLVLPLQEKLEDWKKSLINLDKEHTKEYKKARAELKKKSTDTLRLQKKKARKTYIQGAMQSYSHKNCVVDAEFNKLLASSAAVVQEKRLSLEETERKAVRAALLEERGRFCLLARFLKPVLDEEISMLMELTHLQEVSDQLQRHAASPHHLPAASEQVITDIKGCDLVEWSLATPPSSPSLSIGSRKSSLCSISSLTSSSSGSCKSHPSPSSHPWHRSLSKVSNVASQINQNSGRTAIRPIVTSTWPDLKESSNHFDEQNQNTMNERPHTISSAYEKGHQRPALSVYTFQAPDREASSCCHSQPASPVSSSSCTFSNQQSAKLQLRKNSGGNRPPIPSRCSSLERSNNPMKKNSPGSPKAKAKLPLPSHLAKGTAEHSVHAFEDAENLPPPPAFLLESSSPNASPTPQRSISVSETVRTLTELRHTPASPSLLRKVTGQSHNVPSATVPHNTVKQFARSTIDCLSNTSSGSQDFSNSTLSTTATNNKNPGPGGLGQSFMSVLSAKIISTTTLASNVCSTTSSFSPKSSQNHSAEHLASKLANANSGFLETLNAKLAQKQQQAMNSVSRSADVRGIMSNRMPIMDPLQVRDSLMDQIRRGTSLRKTSGPISDRSAPHIY